jgi:hypothetical protein
MWAVWLRFYCEELATYSSLIVENLTMSTCIEDVRKATEVGENGEGHFAADLSNLVREVLMDGRFVELCKEDPRAAAAQLGLKVNARALQAYQSEDWGALVRHSVSNLNKESYHSIMVGNGGAVACICAGACIPICVAVIIDQAAGAVPDDNWVSDLPPDEDDRM